MELPVSATRLLYSAETDLWFTKDFIVLSDDDPTSTHRTLYLYTCSSNTTTTTTAAAAAAAAAANYYYYLYRPIVAQHIATCFSLSFDNG